ncbi:DNA polymerase IV [bacterium]|nr:DNA polymerase IV [bacterium]
MERIIMHIDVNNAFLSWTAVDLLKKGYKEDIRNRICVIGGNEKTRNGIVLAKSTPAKKCGIVTAETLYSARKKVTYLEVFPPNYKVYSDMSNKLFKLLSEYSPDIEIASIDECYLDYGKVKKLYGDEVEFAYKLKDRIKKELGFTVNIGIANNKLCAKMASDFSKPDKVHTCYDYEKKEKLSILPINELYGVGKKTTEKLKMIGINTVKDLIDVSNEKLSKYFKDVMYLKNLANGINDDEVISEEFNPKGISNEITLSVNVNDIEELKKALFSLSDLVGSRLRKEKKYANVICVILKDEFFKRKSHQKKLKSPTNITKEIYNTSIEILYEFYKNENIRLIGIRLDDLTTEKYYQTSLFENYTERELDSKVDSIIDDINQKFGKSVVKKASVLDKFNRKGN